MSATVQPVGAHGKGKRPAKRLVEAVRLAAGLMGYSLASLMAVPIFWLPDRFHWLKGHLRVDVLQNETVIVPPRHGDDGAPPPVMVALMHEAMRNIQVDPILHGFLAFMFLQYASGLGRRRGAAVVAFTVLAGYVPMLVTRVVGIGFIGYMAMSMWPSSVTVLGLYLVLPRDSRVPRMAFVQLLFIYLMVGFIVVLNFVNPADEWQFLVLVMVVMPAMKELGNILVRGTAQTLTLEEGVGGSGVAVDRSRTWPFFLWLQLAGSMLTRLLFTRIASPAMLTGVLLYQSALEVALRTTLPQRDAWLNRTFRWRGRGSGNGSTWVMPTMSRDSTLSFAGTAASSTPEERNTAFKCYFSLVLVGEQLAEYAAIVLSCAVIITYANAPLVLPLDYYGVQEGFFKHGLSYRLLAQWTLGQLASEFVVDTLCTYLEEQRGYRLIDAWRGRHKRFVLVFVACSCFASLSAQQLVAWRDNISRCRGHDICCCNNGNGLLTAGVLAGYCDRLYPASGAPPAALCP